MKSTKIIKHILVTFVIYFFYMTELSAANSEVILPDNADVTFIVEITCDNEIIVEYTKEVQPLALNRTTNELTGIANILK